jgi:hypothetical protein
MRIKSFCFLVIGLLTAIQAFSRGSAQAICLKNQPDGYVILRVWNPTKCKIYRLTEAQKEAVDIVLLSGMLRQEECGLLPLLGASQIPKFEKIRSKFYSKKGDWKIFVRSAPKLQETSFSPDSLKCQSHLVVISREELRKYLTNNGITDKLNQGF